MIYILGTDCHYENEDLDEIIVMASTKIDDVLEHLYTNIEMRRWDFYTILIVPENDDCFATTIIPRTCAYDMITKYPPQFLLEEENIEEYRHIKTQLYAWCEAVKERQAKEREESNKLKEAIKEKQERELYEKLKAKYGV